MASTLAELRDRARVKADMVNSQFVSDTEANDFINEAANALYDSLVLSHEDYATISVQFSATSSTYALPSDFYKMRGLDRYEAAEWNTVKPFNFLERDRYKHISPLSLVVPVRYRIIKNDLMLLPEDQAAGDYRLWYVPELAKLVNDSDTLAVHSSFAEYVVIAAAIEMLGKEESDTARLERALASCLRRVEAMCVHRDESGPECIADVRGGLDW